MKRVLIASAIVATISVCGVASAKHAGHEMRHHEPVHNMIKHLRGLSLSDAQREEIKGLVSTFKTANPRPVFAENDIPEFELATASETQLTEFVTQKITAKEATFFALAQLRHDIFNVLTSEQQASMLAREEKREAKRESRMQARQESNERREAHFAKRGQSHERGHPMPFRGLDLSDEQKATLATLREDMKDAMATHRETMRSFKEAQQALIRSSAFSKDAFDALVAQYKDELVNAGVAKAKHHQAMFAVLTEAQQSTLKEKRKEERALRDMFRS